MFGEDEKRKRRSLRCCGGGQKNTSANLIKQRSPRSCCLLAWPVRRGSADTSSGVSRPASRCRFRSPECSVWCCRPVSCTYPAVPGRRGKNASPASPVPPPIPLARLNPRAKESHVACVPFNKDAGVPLDHSRCPSGVLSLPARSTSSPVCIELGFRSFKVAKPLASRVAGNGRWGSNPPSERQEQLVCPWPPPRRELDTDDCRRSQQH